jgi:hypothetical protein
LLRRFTPAPLKVQIHLEFVNVSLETNDLTFVLLLSRLAVREPSSKTCLWKMIRDVDVRGATTEPSIIMAGNLILYSRGPACVIGADRERSEILAFIGCDVDAPFFEEAILPSLIRLTELVARRPETPMMARSLEASVRGGCDA